jgi:hypothetical protein
MPPTTRQVPINTRFSRFFPITFVSTYAGPAVQTKAIAVRPIGCVSTVRSPPVPFGNVAKNLRIRCQK